MTRFAVTWSAFGGHRIFDSRTEALTLAALVRANRGEEAVVTELPDDPVVQAPAVSGSPACPALTTVVRPELPDLRTDSEPATMETTVGNASMSPHGLGPDEQIDEVLAILAQDADLRIAKHAERIREFRKRNAAGAYRWPRFTRTTESETGF